MIKFKTLPSENVVAIKETLKKANAQNVLLDEASEGPSNAKALNTSSGSIGGSIANSSISANSIYVGPPMKGIAYDDTPFKSVYVSSPLPTKAPIHPEVEKLQMELSKAQELVTHYKEAYETLLVTVEVLGQAIKALADGANLTAPEDS